MSIHYPEGCGYNKHFQYDCYLNSEGIIVDSIDWAVDNCTSKWGWWFTPQDKQAVISFEDPQELMLWTLTWYHKQHRGRTNGLHRY